MDKEVKKCLVCAIATTHKFKNCHSPDCQCNCISEIRGEVPLPLENWPKWFRIVTRKDTLKFTKMHNKKGV